MSTCMSVGGSLPSVSSSADQQMEIKHRELRGLLASQEGKADAAASSQLLNGRLKPLVGQSPNASIVVTGMMALWVLLNNEELTTADKNKLMTAVAAGACALFFNVILPALKGARKEELKVYNGRLVDGLILEERLLLLNECKLKVDALTKLLDGELQDYQTNAAVRQSVATVGELETLLVAKKEYASADLLVALGYVKGVVAGIRSDGKVAAAEVKALHGAVTGQLRLSLEVDIARVAAQYDDLKRVCAVDPSKTVLDFVRKASTTAERPRRQVRTILLNSEEV